MLYIFIRNCKIQQLPFTRKGIKILSDSFSVAAARHILLHGSCDTMMLLGIFYSLFIDRFHKSGINQTASIAGFPDQPSDLFRSLYHTSYCQKTDILLQINGLCMEGFYRCPEFL